MMDELDRAIIRLLQQDARIPFTRIAEALKQPDTTVHFRARRLRDNGVVTRFTALVSPEALGYHTAGLLRIEIGGHILPQISIERTVSFAEDIASDEQFLWVAVGREPMTIHALCMASDDEDFDARVEALRRSPDVTRVSVIRLEKVVKGWEISGWPER